MSRSDRHKEVGEKTRELLQGSLRHVRAAALAAALVPLAAVVGTPAVAEQCPSGGCPPTPPVSTVPSPCDFITGDGFVLTDSYAKAHFGVHAGCKHAEFWGHVHYHDHGGFNGKRPYRVEGFKVTGYLIQLDPLLPNARDICGFAKTNAGETVRFRVRLEDDPRERGGRGGHHHHNKPEMEMFGIRLSNGYLVTTRRMGGGHHKDGEVAFHKHHHHDHHSTPPNPIPSEAEMCGGLATP